MHLFVLPSVLSISHKLESFGRQTLQLRKCLYQIKAEQASRSQPVGGTLAWLLCQLFLPQAPAQSSSLCIYLYVFVSSIHKLQDEVKPFFPKLFLFIVFYPSNRNLTKTQSLPISIQKGIYVQQGIYVCFQSCDYGGCEVLLLCICKLEIQGNLHTVEILRVKSTIPRTKNHKGRRGWMSSSLVETMYPALFSLFGLLRPSPDFMVSDDILLYNDLNLNEHLLQKHPYTLTQEQNLITQVPGCPLNNDVMIIAKCQNQG